ncbi:SMP-30/gluconolactonase/LRE family protein [Kitasatospora sp. NPDC092286]|uniref:SMP-30/gluconolactonase/LRE family protein n=1 Tax=Kitasatospora sp. NPDC092286 TaxID=3364087 RepID=UPI00381934C2
MEWEIAVAAGAELGERPVWDDRTGELVWVDLAAGTVHRHRPGGDSAVRYPGTVGAAGLRAAGGHVLAAGTDFVLTGPDGGVERRIPLPGAPAGVAFNDGAVDPAGRFWAGTAALDLRPGGGALYLLEPDLTVRLVLDGVTESNGLAWNLAGDLLHYVDSGAPEPRVRAFPYDKRTGELGAPRDLARFGPGDGIPDGLTVDREDCLWVALWEGAAVRRYGPDGTLLAHLPLPVRLATCPGFGGPGLDLLYVTTARQGLDPAARAAEPSAGHVLVTRPGVRGVPAHRFAN